MNEDIASIKMSRLGLGIAILVVVVGFNAAGIHFRHSDRLKARLDAVRDASRFT